MHYHSKRNIEVKRKRIKLSLFDAIVVAMGLPDAILLPILLAFCGS